MVPCTPSPQPPDLTAAEINRSCPVRLPTQVLTASQFSAIELSRKMRELTQPTSKCNLEVWKVNTTEDPYPKGMGVTGYVSPLWDPSVAPST